MALVLGMHDAVSERVGVTPVVLLDDAFSLLDPVRRERLGEALPGGAQVIAAASDARELPSSRPWSVALVTSIGVSFDA